MSSTRYPPQNRWLAFYSELIGTWTRKTGRLEDAEDATHDVVVGVLEGDGTAALNQRAYLHRSVHNGLADSYRRQRIIDTVPLHELAEDEHPLQTDVDSAVRAEKLYGDMREALKALPLKCRQVFIWQRIEGYTQEEIAQRLDISVNMVQRYMMRALRHLRKELEQHAPH
jgi:RNA polymerase sigma factor (sigma-70 family)